MTVLVISAGTAASFRGQSYVLYRPPEAQNWHIHFYLKTLQPQAVLLVTNDTASISLKVRPCESEIIHGKGEVWVAREFRKGNMILKKPFFLVKESLHSFQRC